MILIDGKKAAADARGELKQRVQSMKNTPGLAVVLVGNDPASEVYVRGKIRASEEIGIYSVERRLSATASQEEVESAVRSLVSDEKIHGVLVQLPLPKGLNPDAVLKLIPPEKDVDGFSPVNAGKVALNEAGIPVCTPSGVMELLKKYGIETAGNTPW